MKRNQIDLIRVFIVLLLMAPITYAYIFGPPSYKYYLSSVNHPYAPITTDDFNGDGNPDIVWGDHDHDSCQVFLGYGDGTFEPLDPFYVSPKPFEIVTGDFTSDGIIDLVILDVTGTDSLYVFEGEGDGTFQLVNKLDMGTYYPDHMDVGDLNCDGNLDLALCSEGWGYFFAYLGDGDGSFTNTWMSEPVSIPLNIHVADVNLDSIPDIVGPGVEAPLFIGNGDGTFQSPIILIPYASGGIGDACTGDFDEDGDIDIIIADCEGMSSPTIMVYINQGNLEFVPSDSTYLDGWGGFGITTEDLDLDGHLDLIMISSHLWVLPGYGNGYFSDSDLLYFQYYAAGRYVALADYDRDGDMDIAYFGGQPPNSRDSLMVRLNTTIPVGIGIEEEEIEPAGFTFSASQNPFSESVVFEAVGDCIPSQLLVIDISGRLIRILEKDLEANRFFWNGSDSNGYRVPSGVFLILGRSAGSTMIYRS